MCVCPYASIGVGNMGKPLLPVQCYNKFVNLVLSRGYKKYFKLIYVVLSKKTSFIFVYAIINIINYYHCLYEFYFYPHFPGAHFIPPHLPSNLLLILPDCILSNISCVSLGCAMKLYPL